MQFQPGTKPILHLMNLSFQRTVTAWFCLLILCAFAGFSQQPRQSSAVINTLFNNPSMDAAMQRQLLETTSRSGTGVMSTTPVNQTVMVGPFTVDITSIGTVCRYSTGAIIARATGGTPPYTYSLNEGIAYRNGWITQKAAGNYTLTITDAAGHVESIAVNISNTFEGTSAIVGYLRNATGCTNSDASATVAASGGTPPYTYSWDRVNYQSDPVFNNLAPAEYMFSVKDANGCVGSGIHSIAGLGTGGNCEPGNLNFSYTTMYSCFNTGHISVTASGQFPPFTYSLNQVDWQTIGEFDNIAPGLTSVYGKDSKGNIMRRSVFMYQSCFPILNIQVTKADCKQTNGSVTVSVIKSNPPFLYSIDGINWVSSNTFTNLVPGTYRMGVKEAGGEIGYGLFTVEENCPKLSVAIKNDECNTSNGSITVTAANGVPPYTYSIDGVNFQTGNQFNNLGSGTYPVTVKDAAGNTASDFAGVSSKCFKVNYQAFASMCGWNNGTVDIMASGGTEPYQFSLDGINYQSVAQFINLSPGNYNIHVKDSDGEVITEPILITDDGAPVLTIALTPPTCNNPTASIQLSSTGTWYPHTYSLDKVNWQSGGLFTGLPANQTFFAYVKDQYGCITQEEFNTNIRCLQLTVTAIPAKCNTGSGSIKAVAADGAAPYEYSINGIDYQTSPDFSGLFPNTYTIYVRDQDGAIKQAAIQVSNTCPTPQLTITDETCSKSNGRVSFTGNGGTAPYTYSLTSGNFQAISSFSNLPAGTYRLYIKDDDGYINSAPFTIVNTPGPLIGYTGTAASCNNNDGSITLSATGNGPFLYKLNQAIYQASPVFTSLASGDHNAMVQDINGCETGSFPVVTLNNNLTVDAGPDLRICEGSRITISASSNADQFTWTGNHITDASTLHPGVSPVTTTRYEVVATKGPCRVQDDVLVTVDPAPVAIAGPASVICFGKDAQLQGSGGTQYQWTPSSWLSDSRSAAPIVRKPTQTTTYRLRVTDNNNCGSLNEASVTVTVTPPPKINAGPDLQLARNQPHPLNAVDVNNSGFTSYSWQPIEGLSNPYIANPIARLNRSTTFTITASTAAGCEGVGRLTIKVNDGPEIYVPSAFTPNGDGKNDLLKALPVGIKTFKYFAIFNRYGQRIFYTADPGKGWDGMISNGQQATNSFVWMAEGIDFNGNIIQRKGTVVLLR